MLTKAQRDEIRERWAAATPGPWRICVDTEHEPTTGQIVSQEVIVETDDERELFGAVDGTTDDAEAIALAPTDIPALLADVEALEVEIRRLRWLAENQTEKLLPRLDALLARIDARPDEETP
jgi:hypothetical protein